MVVTAKQREDTGFEEGEAKGKYPMPNEEKCISAVRLRHHGKGVTAAQVLNKASRYANRNNWSR
jgi:hypothetical protein